MPTTRRTYDRFEYIVYEKKTKDDFRQFKDEVLKLESAYDNRKDIIVDLSKCDNLFSPEIGALAKMAGMAENAKKHLRLVVLPLVKASLQQMTLATLDNVVFYDSMQELLAQLKKEQEQGPHVTAAKQGSETLAFEGALSGPKVKEMSEQIQTALKGNAKCVVVDLAKVERLDSVCVGELMTLDDTAKNLGKTIALANPSEEVLAMLREASLDKILEILPRVK
jgi:anti-anti-sigma factor